MDHVVVPLGPSHARAVGELVGKLAVAAGCGPEAAPPRPHITVVSYSGLAPEQALAALRPVTAGLAPFTVRAHGYGIFTGDEPRDLSLHVIVVRTRALDDLHRRAHRALRAAGARTDGLTAPRVWTPHITLLDRELTPVRLARAVEALAPGQHRSWSVRIAELAVGRRAGGPVAPPLPLTGPAGRA